MRVDGDAGVLEPPNFGDGWGQNAYRFLQDALADAPQLLDQGAAVVQIWVAATGTANPYRPDQNAQFGGGDECATFSMHNDIRLYGGFLGGETQLMQRDPENNTTVLNGVLGFEFTPPCGDPKAGDCAEAHSTPGCDDPACCQAVCGVMPSCCTVEWDPGCVDLANAGVVCEHCGNPGAADCFTPTGVPGCSSASCCAIVCSLEGFESCCTSAWDVLCALQAILECRPQAHHVVTAIGVDESARLDGFTVTGGYADAGGDHGNDGAGALLIDASPVIARSMFRDNVALFGGGAGIEVTGTAGPTVINCSFTRNWAAEGQGMRLEGSAAEPIVVVNCAFFVQQINFTGGSAILANGPDVDIKNCTFWFNDTTDLATSGGEVKIANGSQVTITNTILWGLDHGPHVVVVGAGSSATFSHSNIEHRLSSQGVRALDGGTVTWILDDNDVDTNIGEDIVLHHPMFVQPDIGNLRFAKLCSRCIDRADTSAVPLDDFDVDNDGNVQELTPDLSAMDRLRNGLQVGDAVVDMGAYEFVPFILAWDCQVNPDGAVGVVDLLDLLGQWQQVCTSCDFGLDPVGVDTPDLLALLAHWGEVAPGSGAPAPPSLEEELADACLTMGDWDQHVDTMTDPNSTQEERDNSNCWMRHYIDDCDNCSCDPPTGCPGPDPFD